MHVMNQIVSIRAAVLLLVTIVQPVRPKDRRTIPSSTPTCRTWP